MFFLQTLNRAFSSFAVPPTSLNGVVSLFPEMRQRMIHYANINPLELAEPTIPAEHIRKSPADTLQMRIMADLLIRKIPTEHFRRDLKLTLEWRLNLHPRINRPLYRRKPNQEVSESDEIQKNRRRAIRYEIPEPVSIVPLTQPLTIEIPALPPWPLERKLIQSHAPHAVRDKWNFPPMIGPDPAYLEEGLVKEKWLEKLRTIEHLLVNSIYVIHLFIH